MPENKREEIIATVRACAEKLGRPPSIADFRKQSKISWHQVYKHFRGMRAAVRAAGLEPGPRGGPLTERALVLDWARVVRELGRLPSRAEYSARGKHHAVTLHARVGWPQMAHRFVLLVREFHLEREWEDVVEIVCRKFPLLNRSLQHSTAGIQPDSGDRSIGLSRDRIIGPSDHRPIGRSPSSPSSRDIADISPQSAKTARPGDPVMGSGPDGHALIYGNRNTMRLGKLVSAALAIEILLAAQKASDVQMARSSDDPMIRSSDDPISRSPNGLILYGEPLGLAAMAHAPINEDGVLFLFGVLAADLGFRVERIQREFPDCEAKREIVPGKWERVRIEFEYESRNFKEHRHDPTACQVIVCWKHNWPDLPEGLEVVELSRVVRGM